MVVETVLRIASASLSILSACDLVRFISLTHDKYPSLKIKQVDRLIEEESHLSPWIEALLTDIFLSILFCVQHSLFKSSNLQLILKDGAYERVVYIFTMYFVVYILKHCWQPIPEIILWDNHNNPWISTLFGFIHVFSWYLIYASFLIMEWSDLSGAASPKTRSCSLHRFFKHYRHGSFIGFVLILFVRSVMSLDRWFLAMIWSFYMYLAWRPDKQDLEYQISMWELKKNDLSQL